MPARVVSDLLSHCYENNSHEYTSQIKLDLETDVDVGSVDGRAPPKSKPTIGNLVETGTLGIGELLVSHGFLEPGCLLPE